MMMAVPSGGHIEITVIPMPSGGHIDVAVVPMPMSLTDVNSDAADPDFDVLRDDHWFVAGVRRTGKYWKRQEWNNKKREQSILHGTLLGWGRSTSRYRHAARSAPQKSVSD
jgi:hypothetical protein